MRTAELRGDVAPRYFVAAKQHLAAMSSPTLLIALRPKAPTIAAVRKTIESVDAACPSSLPRRSKRNAPMTAQDRTTAQLAVCVWSVALMLAPSACTECSYSVARRIGEIAIRIALGAHSRRVISMILRETVGVVGVGLALGGGLAYVASRLVDSRLYGVAPQDPLTLALATALLLVVALCAAYVPAQRASRVDPMAAVTSRVNSVLRPKCERPTRLSDLDADIRTTIEREIHDKHRTRDNA